MKGTVLHYDLVQAQGLLRAEDGCRYPFAGAACPAGTRPRPGDDVDFEWRDDAPADIYIVRSAGDGRLALTGAASDHVRALVTKTAGSVVDIYNTARSGATQRTTPHVDDQAPAEAGLPLGEPKDWRVVFAVASLVASLLPVASYAGASVNLFDIGPKVGATLDGLNQFQHFYGGLLGSGNPWGGPTAAAPGAADGLGALSYAGWLRLSYLFYLVPLLAVIILGKRLRSRDESRFALWHGVACLLPAGFLFAFGLLLPSIIPNQGPFALVGTAASPLSFIGLGAWALALVGVGQILALRGYVRRSPRAVLFAHA